MSPAELLKKVRKVEIRTKGLAQHNFAGEYHSAFKGRGMTVAGVRAYQYGDDVRFIDWNVTARYNEPYIKQFEEERELTVMLLIDVSASTLFGTQQRSKQELITELSAVLAFSALGNNDKVGVIFFTDKIEKFIPPRKGRNHILTIIRELLAFEPQSKTTNLEQALNFVSQTIKRRCITFIISDFSDISNFETGLRTAARQHDCIGVEIYDAFDRELPKAGLLLIQDAETGNEYWINTEDELLRKNYWENQLEKQNATKQTFSKNGADLLQVSTAQDYFPDLHRFLRSRARR
ncbi:MAG: DUF58 domain-containing protein [Sphingobacteriales bacterium]|nr:MAG: DUF58 domain-containing protein [Sphingobacteriales bacterium]